VWLRRPAPGKRIYNVLICHNCGVANGLHIEKVVEPEAPAYNYDHLLPPGAR
jgi:hypothetical protein